MRNLEPQQRFERWSTEYKTVALPIELLGHVFQYTRSKYIEIDPYYLTKDGSKLCLSQVFKLLEGIDYRLHLHAFC